MRSNECQVTQTIEWLQETIENGQLNHPRCRQLATEILELMKGVAQGRAAPDTMGTIESLAQEIVALNAGGECTELAQALLDKFRSNQEAFQNHIDSQICPTGSCLELTPAPCQMACPAGIDIPSYLMLTGQGRYKEAVELIRKDNPFPWVCGLVCTHPCEFMCVRGRMDSPIAIMDVKGVAAEQAMSGHTYVNPEKMPDNGRKVCIIGAGPGGLTAAYYLALRGYRVTVLEALPVAGGMLMVGIPRYRLPREVIDREIAMIEDLGVEIRLNTRLGENVTYEDLQAEGFHTFLLAVGAHSSYKLMLPGEDDFDQVIPAVSFLKRVSLGDRHKPGNRVAVIGGGNVAIDAARTCIRLGCEEVSLLYRRTRAEMPAHDVEVREAEEEGVQFSFLSVPKAINGENGCLRGITCLRAELVESESGGRKRPVPIEGSEHSYEVDAIIPAIGQEVNDEGLEEFEGINWSRRKTIQVNTATMSTSQENVFAVGDAVTGPATVVEAIGGGKKAAAAIHRSFEGIPQPSQPTTPVRRRQMELMPVSASEKMALKRPEMKRLKTERRRITFQQVQLGIEPEEAHSEAKRCLRCDVCIRCGRCVEICRDKMGVGALMFGYLDFDRPGMTDLNIAAERCIGCGACATNCPTNAIRCEDIDGERVLSLCGTVLNRLALEYCERCGAVLGPARYHDYIAERLKDISPSLVNQRICLHCAREQSGKQLAEMQPPHL